MLAANDKLCGAECLYVALHALNTKEIPNSFAKFASSLPLPSSDSGYTLAALFDFATKKGIHAKLLKLDQSQLIDVSKKNLVILHLPAPGHFILCESATTKGVSVFDPESRSFFLSTRQLAERWKGNCLVLSNAEIILSTGSKRPWIGMITLVAVVSTCVIGCVFFSVRRLRAKERFRGNLLILLTIGLAFFVGCSDPGNLKDAASTRRAQGDGALVILGESNQYLGEAKQGEVLRAGFTIKNDSTSSLHIHQLKPSCSCTSAVAVPEVLAAGESGLVNLIVDIDKTSTQEASTIIVSDRGSSRVRVTWKLQGGLSSSPVKFPIVNVSSTQDGECSTKLFGIDPQKEYCVTSVIEDKGKGIQHSALISGELCKIAVSSGSGARFGNYSGYVEIRDKESDSRLLRIPWVARVTVPLNVMPRDVSFRPSQRVDFYEAQIVAEVEDSEHLDSIGLQTVPKVLPSLSIEKTSLNDRECVMDLRMSKEDLERIEKLSVFLSGSKYSQDLVISR